MQFLIKSFVQAGAALLLATVCWGLHRLLAGLRGRGPERWSVWLGLTPPPSLRLGLALFAAFLAIGALVAVLGHSLVPGYDALARESPQWAIAQQPLAGLLLAVPAYAFLMTGFSEELLFRGVLAKRLIHWLGLRIGNLAQAALLALLHVVIVYVAVPEPGPALIAFAALFPGRWPGSRRGRWCATTAPSSHRGWRTRPSTSRPFWPTWRWRPRQGRPEPRRGARWNHRSGRARIELARRARTILPHPLPLPCAGRVKRSAAK